MATKKNTKASPRKTARKVSPAKKTAPTKKKATAPKKTTAKNKATATKKTTAKKKATATKKTTTKKRGGSKKSASTKNAAARERGTTRGKAVTAGGANAASEVAEATPAERRIRVGVITHTDLGSSEPSATVDWCQKVFGWKFGEPMPTPNGPYYMWQFGDNMGGGVRALAPSENPGTIPYVEVPDIGVAHHRAIRDGATSVMPPSEIPGGMGWIAIVSAPGGVSIGLWAPK